MLSPSRRRRKYIYIETWRASSVRRESERDSAVPARIPRTRLRKRESNVCNTYAARIYTQERERERACADKKRERVSE